MTYFSNSASAAIGGRRLDGQHLVALPPFEEVRRKRLGPTSPGDRLPKNANHTFDRGCVETPMHAGSLAIAETDGFNRSQFFVEMCAVKEGVFALAASSSSHILPDGHHQFVSPQQIDDPAQVVAEDMQAHLRFDVL